MPSTGPQTPVNPLCATQSSSRARTKPDRTMPLSRTNSRVPPSSRSTQSATGSGARPTTAPSCTWGGACRDFRVARARPAHVSPRLVDSGAGDAERVGGERPTVHGTVTVSLARYLQVEVDLLYSRPASGQAAASNTAPTRFRLVSQRRMRSGELHYIDHPLFGVLILLTPL